MLIWGMMSCETTILEMTIEMSLAVEGETRLQRQSRLWFHLEQHQE